MPISRESIPSVIKINDQQIANINRDLDTFKKRNTIYQTIGMKEKCILCDSYSCKKLVFPIGDVNSPIMVISDRITQENIESKAPFTDTNNFVFQILLEKLNIKKDDIYMTSLYKCLGAEESSKFICAGCILLPEINIVRPKVIIGIGEEVAKVLFPLMHYNCNPAEAEPLRGKIHPLQVGEYVFNYVQTYNIDTVVKDFEKLSGNFAKDIMAAMKVAGK